jgi:hypothetical protein
MDGFLAARASVEALIKIGALDRRLRDNDPHAGAAACGADSDPHSSASPD